jgi:hypothetical protein
MNLSASSAKYHALMSLGDRGGSSQFGRLPHLHQRPFRSSAMPVETSQCCVLIRNLLSILGY